jgi:amino acid transporter
MLLLVPLFWSLPETLIIGELSSMLPEEGGYYKWVQRAFGRFWAFQNGWWTWMYSLVDMAIYPVLFTQYLAFFAPSLPPSTRWIIALAVIWGATAINLSGAARVGFTSILAGAFVLGAFGALSLAAIPHIHHVPWVPFTIPGHSTLGGLGVGLSIALWNYIGWDNPSTVEGEVVNPGRSYPRALAITLPLVAAGYLVPLLASAGASDWSKWREGGWPDIARMSAGMLGEPLAVVIAIAGMVSAVALFNALLMSYSRIPLVIAEDGFLPAAFAKTDSRGTPRNAILFSAVFYSVFALVPFGRLVVADVLLYAMALFLEFGALLALRYREPLLRGSFRIPAGLGVVTALAALPMLILIAVVGLEIRDGTYGLPAVLGAIGAAALGPVVYYFSSRPREAA